MEGDPLRRGIGLPKPAWDREKETWCKSLRETCDPCVGSHRKSRREYAAETGYAKVQQINGSAKTSGRKVN